MSSGPLDDVKETAGSAFRGLEAIGASLVEQDKENFRKVQARGAKFQQSAKAFLEKPGPTIAEASSSLNEKIKEGFDFVSSQFEATAVEVKEKVQSLAPTSASEEQPAAMSDAKAPVAEQAASPSVVDKIAEAFEKPAAAISEKASELNDKIMAGFEAVGHKLEGATSAKEGEGAKEDEGSLAKVGDKIVEAVIEKPAAALTEAVSGLESKIAGGLCGTSVDKAEQ